PVGGSYTMNAQEAAEAAQTIKPKIAIPTHYGDIVGSKKDAQEFKRRLEDTDIKVEVIDNRQQKIDNGKEK
ncbi:MAG TPA: MBL fold metallo-hydrolase, partial [Patescibacteria group bacterium]|nr:MBL fold metallo-hydrolase [Patescibacteria group bacterium]